MTMLSIQQNIQNIIQQINEYSEKYKNSQSQTQLIAVTKTKPIKDIKIAAEAGLTHFGENYVQEAIDKIHYFKNENANLCWHFIGPIQSNKTRLIAAHFNWVHSIERSKIAQRLNEQRPTDLPPLQVLIQINTSSEISKSGMNATKKSEIVALADEIEKLPNLTLRGLMCIPESVDNFEAQLANFTPLKALFDQLKERYVKFDTLSMGMSNDMEAAIACGSNMVRIGSAIFGQR